MQSDPLKNIDVASVVFIADAAHKGEEKLLYRWIAETKKRNDYKGDIHIVTVSFEDKNLTSNARSIAAEIELPDSALLIPLRVVWKTPIDKLDNKPRFRELLGGNPRKPSRFRAWRILRNNPERAVVIAGKPGVLGEMKIKFAEQSKKTKADATLGDYIVGRASLTLDVDERRLRGGRYKAPRQVAKAIRASHAYKQGLQNIIEETGLNETQLRERALPMFNELISKPHNFWQDVMASFNRSLMSMGYEDRIVIDKKRLLDSRKIVQDNPTALLWTHKTHVDGMAVQTVLFENDFPTVHTIGGINMAFAGLGFLARRAGAIFIRRSFQDDALYKLVLRSYLGYLLEKNYPLTWSFEGTRSRVGKLMPPRYGILKYVMEAVANSSVDTLHIIPVAINYDMINDVKDYASEQAGGRKRPESLSWFVSYVRRLRQPLGRIYIDFGDPVKVNCAQMHEDKLALEKAAFRVGVEANRVSPITITSIMAMSLLGSAPRAQTIGEMRAGLDVLREWARRRNIPLTSDFESDNEEHMREIVDAMVSSKLIDHYDEGPEAVYAVVEDKHTLASYYRNTIVHHFVNKAIAEMSLLSASRATGDALADFWEEASQLRDLFKFEFFYAPREKFFSEVENELNHYDADWQTKLKKSPQFATVLLESLDPIIAHSVLRPYIEAYRVVAEVFDRLKPNETLDKKASSAAAFKYARQAYLQRRINSRASIGKILFDNGYKLLDSYGLVGSVGDDNSKNTKLATDLVKRRHQMSRRLRVLTHRLEHVRALSLPNQLD